MLNIISGNLIPLNRETTTKYAQRSQRERGREKNSNHFQ